MAEIIFLVFATTYSVVASKVSEWITLRGLGQEGQVPLFFLRKPGIYAVVSQGIFLIALVASFMTTYIPWYLCLGVLAVLWITTGWIGRKKAFGYRRRTLRKMVELDYTPEQKADLEAALRMTDLELLNIVKLHWEK